MIVGHQENFQEKRFLPLRWLEKVITIRPAFTEERVSTENMP